MKCDQPSRRIFASQNSFFTLDIGLFTERALILLTRYITIDLN